MTLTQRAQKEFPQMEIQAVRIGEYGNVEIKAVTEFGLEWIPTPYNSGYFYRNDNN